MVLLNGVKYACERCIRGHRVSSCTHTDKPLTMIKPKGRPASQCPHCREQRKLKNAHATCSCGKKGKSPGQHLASCLCHKNSHCTCPTKEKKPKKEKEKKMDVLERDKEHKLKQPGSALKSNYLIEDVMVPFETDQGLLQYFSHDIDDKHYNTDARDKDSLSDKPLHPQQLQGLHLFPNPPSDADLDIVENMFPLFPLVGTCSFDDSKSLPLLPIPQSANLHLNGKAESRSRLMDEDRHFVATRMNNSSSSFNTFQGSPSIGSQNGTNSGPFSPHVHSTTSLSGMNKIHTQHPRPLKPSASFTSANAILHQNRPRRPDSLLSIASTSSNTSKQNLFEASTSAQHNLPKLASSTAFPPYQLLESNSTDDFHHEFYGSSGIFNDAQLFSILSDYDDISRNGPLSTLPSRQTLQSKRNTPLTRSHSQLNHNLNHNTMSKDHPLLPLKGGSSSESSPHQSLGVFSPIDLLTHFKQNGELQLHQVNEELPLHMTDSIDELSVVAPPMLESGSHFDGDSVSNFAEYLEITAVPMFQEFVNPLKHDF